jgi:glycosyltransferase involved in cell wall biosynthesis
MATRILGICLVRNEENFVLWALGNALEFCDELLVIDNLSTDRTYELLQAFAAAHPKVRLVRDPDASGTNRYVQEHIGKDVWAFGVDGDEIYDRLGLQRFRARILSGEFADHWRIRPQWANATRIDFERSIADAYPLGSAGKLFNLSVLKSWRADRERLHGPFVLRQGVRKIEANLNRTEPWTASDFRCLHLCFFPRSGLDGTQALRNNIVDDYWKHAWRRPVFGALLKLRMFSASQRRYLARRALPIKNRDYMGGEIERLALSGFGRPSDFAGFDPNAHRTEQVIAELTRDRAEEPDLRSPLEREYHQIAD